MAADLIMTLENNNNLDLTMSDDPNISISGGGDTYTKEQIDEMLAEKADLADIPQIDDTLTVPGAAADAKKTGDEISGLKSDLKEPS